MGFFSKIMDQSRNGQDRRIECLTCGDYYRGNIDRAFPYAICGSCLERGMKQAQRDGDTHRYQQARWELDRRRRTF